MHAEAIGRKVAEYQSVAHALWERIAGMRAAAGTRGIVPRGLGSGVNAVSWSRFLPRTLGSLFIASTVLAITYSIAATLVNGATRDGYARANHTVALQLAATNYRLARAECQRVSEYDRSACISEAHAAEDRARAVARLAPQSLASDIRSRTVAAMDAGERDSIIIEPACSVVSRGQASVCEIQVKSSAAGAPGEARVERRAMPRDEKGERNNFRAMVQTPTTEKRTQATNGAPARLRASGEARETTIPYLAAAAN